MKARIIPFVLILAMGFCYVGTSQAHHAAMAQAVPLTRIQIDGNLSDWPTGMIWYPVLTNGHPYGLTDIDQADLTTSPDLTPRFTAGYNPKENLLYLAIWVRDESLVVSGSDPWHTDACEVYVDGDHSGGKVTGNWNQMPASDLAALQYVAIPGEGTYGPGYKSNPSLMSGETGKMRTRMAYRRTGDVTTYEWAIEAFDRYPDVPTKLEPGKTIGFDVVVVDKDGQTDIPAWICWAPFGVVKFSNADLLGDLVLVKSYGDLGSIAGKVMKAEEKTPGDSGNDMSEFVGKPAPEFTRNDLKGKEVRLVDFKGKVVIVDFWATWCGPCISEIPDFIALQSRYASKGFTIIGVSTDAKASIVKRFVTKYKINYPVLMADIKVQQDYGEIQAIPTTFVIDKKGIIRYAYVGVPSDKLVFRRNVEELLAE